MSQPGLPSPPSDSDIRNLRSLWDLARNGYKVINSTSGKTLNVGIGNRQGLHSYAYTLAAEKWVNGEKRFFNKLRKLQVGDVIIEKMRKGYEDEGFRMTWTQGLYELFQTIKRPADLQTVGIGR